MMWNEAEKIVDAITEKLKDLNQDDPDQPVLDLFEDYEDDASADSQ